MSVEGTAGEDSYWIPRVLVTSVSEERPGGSQDSSGKSLEPGVEDRGLIM